ncbi:MAG: WYL domain-containing protein, partial [Campylobacterota bacterium]|nr:WYL domain-containing protein [Campylobacterota bacterium]
MATNQTERVLELIKRFNDGQIVCIEQLQTEYMWEGKSERTIGRDLKVIKDYFPESFELLRNHEDSNKACYKAITKDAFENFMKPEVLSLMVQTFNMASRSDLFDNFDLDADDKRIISKKVKELNNIYEFKNKPFENAKSDSKIFKTLERNIKNQKCIIIEYPNLGELTKIEVKPYKMLFINENFYLACEVEHEDYQFSMYRISKIKTIEDTSKTYHKNYDIESFIKDIQTPFSRYTQNYKDHLIDIKLEINSKKAFFFKSKKYLKSQNIDETKEDGSLIVSYKVTQEYEVEELIKRWLPYVKVIEPLSL